MQQISFLNHPNFIFISSGTFTILGVLSLVLHLFCLLVVFEKFVKFLQSFLSYSDYADRTWRTWVEQNVQKSKIAGWWCCNSLWFESQLIFMWMQSEMSVSTAFSLLPQFIWSRSTPLLNILSWCIHYKINLLIPVQRLQEKHLRPTNVLDGKIYILSIQSAKTERK